MHQKSKRIKFKLKLILDFFIQIFIFEKNCSMNHNDGSCKNCGYNFKDEEDYKFCPKCGQTLETHRINFHYVAHELQHGILHVDKGILNTSKALFTKPGIMIREYLEGKRKNHFSPIIFIVILCSILALIKHYVYHDDMFGLSEMKIYSQQTDIQKKVKNLLLKPLDWYYKHLVLVNLLQIPFMSIGFYLSYKKMSKYNFFEWMLIMAFCSIQQMVITILFLLLNKLIPGASFFVSIITFLIFSWTILQLFSKYDVGKVILNFFIGLSINFIFLMIIIIATIIYIFRTHPELIHST